MSKQRYELTLTLLAARAVGSLWNVATRRYTGRGGSIYHIKRSAVEMATYGLICESENVLNTMTLQLAKLNDDGSCDGELVGSQRLNYVPDDFELTDGSHTIDSPRIELPARQRDHRVFSTSKRRLFPFSPKGSQRV